MGNKLLFEWDEEKNRANMVKHGIDFAVAARVFEDDNRIEFYDLKHSEEEDRYQTIGMVGRLLFVIYTERGARIRLISARRANAQERSLYYDSLLYFDKRPTPYP